MDELLLKIKDLSLVYETDTSTVKAINGLDLELYKGETLGLVGETGAGKTSAALSIMRLLPDRVGFLRSGEILFDGKDLAKASENEMRRIRGEEISMIFADPMTSLNPLLTIGDQIKEVLDTHHPEMCDEDREHRVDEMLTTIGLSPDRKEEYPHQFSGGMKQRIVIAMGLACDPKLLLADEPTTALDVTIQAQVLQMMTELQKKLGTSIMLITHDLGVVAQTCQRVAVMYAGEIIEYGTVEQLFSHKANHPYTTGLFDSIPDMKSDAKWLKPIDGMMPDPAELPEGCKFHERCPHCTDRCKTEHPAMHTVNGHSIRCHLFEPKAAEKATSEARGEAV